MKIYHFVICYFLILTVKTIPNTWGEKVCLFDQSIKSQATHARPIMPTNRLISWYEKYKRWKSWFTCFLNTASKESQSLNEIHREARAKRVYLKIEMRQNEIESEMERQRGREHGLFICMFYSHFCNLSTHNSLL